MEQKEIWKFIKSFPDYEVSNLGRVRSNKVHWKGYRILKRPTISKYHFVTLYKEGKGSGSPVHKLVLEAFVGSCPLGCEANHKNGIKIDDQVKNLEWISRGENLAHAYRIGLRVIDHKGESHPQAKLKSKDISEIRRLAEQNIKQNILAKMFKVSRSHINNIIHYRVWNYTQADDSSKVGNVVEATT